MQRWLARRNRGRSPVIAIIGGLLMLSAGVESIANRGPHAINPAPLAASLGFFAMGIVALAIGTAEIREQRRESR